MSEVTPPELAKMVELVERHWQADWLRWTGIELTRDKFFRQLGMNITPVTAHCLIFAAMVKRLTQGGLHELTFEGCGDAGVAVYRKPLADMDNGWKGGLFPSHFMGCAAAIDALEGK